MTLAEYARIRGRPELLSQWDGEKNDGLTPETVTCGADRKVWWRCSRGHEWQTQVYARTSGGKGCPYCAGQLPIVGETDLATRCPEAAALWHPTKNGNVRPEQVMPGSHQVCWWRCAKGHEWRAQAQAVTGGTGCPYCAGRLPIPGETDLATTHPALAAQWHPALNDALTPELVSSGSARTVWWRCEKGHAYEQRVYARVAGDGCPYCAGKKVLAGFNDLATTNPELLPKWDCERNGDVTPQKVNRGSHEQIWWKCELGHSYKQAVYSKIAGADCPYCTGKKVLVGFNDLATTHPKVAAQWYEPLNGELTPQMVTKGSNKKAWFQCSEGHVWQAAIFSRTRKKASDCPVCAGTVKRARIISQKPLAPSRLL